jgi:hypothetical protein
MYPSSVREHSQDLTCESGVAGVRTVTPIIFRHTATLLPERSFSRSIIPLPSLADYQTNDREYHGRC